MNSFLLRHSACGAVLWLAILLPCPTRAEDSPSRRIEGYSAAVLAKLQERDRQLRARVPATVNGQSRAFVIRRLQRWQPGATLKVAFQGGDSTLREQIAKTAAEWLQHGNIGLQFKDPATGKFYEWAATDSTFKYEVRIAFNGRGYWSLVGTDSINSAVASPGSPSMNFDGFDLVLPTDYEGVIRHEFGHAFGFEHEHQSPVGGCDNEFRWEDDAGYVRTQQGVDGPFVPDSMGHRPGIYTVLQGRPNNWSRSMVNDNLRQFPNSSAFLIGPFDKDSIMKYFFEAWMFKDGEHSRCYSLENEKFSPQDIAGFKSAYPRTPAHINRVLTLQATFLNSLSRVQDLGTKVRQGFKEQLTRVNAARQQ